MIRILISEAAYSAIAASLPDGAGLREPQTAAEGGFFIWLPRMALNRLRAARGRGEGYSETILRLAASE